MPEDPDAPLTYARINYENGQLYSLDYNDTYYSSQGALEESSHVFLNANKLPARFADRSSQNAVFHIAELGFGTGLNFLNTAYLFFKTTAGLNQTKILHYFAVENRPVEKKIIEKFYTDLCKEQTTISCRLKDKMIRADIYLRSGFHLLKFSASDYYPASDCSVYLHLYYGDVKTFFEDLTEAIPFDVWYLDGFSPSKNAEMFSCAVFHEIARRSNENTTLTSYSVAGMVKENLQHEGFQIQKLPGFGKKRHMLLARKARAVEKQDELKKHPIYTEDKKVAVIGAGLAGAAIARSLAGYGFRVTVYESEANPATQGSGNHRGAFYPVLSAQDTRLSLLSLRAFEYLNFFFTNHRQHIKSLKHTGVLQLLNTDRIHRQISGFFNRTTPDKKIVQLVDQDQLKKLFSDGMTTEISDIFSDTPSEPVAAFYPQGGYVHPPELVHYLINHPNITLITSEQVLGLSKSPATGKNVWEVDTTSGSKPFDLVVGANSYDIKNIEQFKWLPVTQVRGQLLYLHTETEKEPGPVLCYDGYSIPAAQGIRVIGAGYDVSNMQPEIDQSLNSDLFDKFCSALNQSQKPVPLLKNDIDLSSGRVAYRAMPLDHLPVAGTAPDYATIQKHGANKSLLIDPSRAESDFFYSNLYIFTGFASRGLHTILYAAELLAAKISDRTDIAESHLCQSLEPIRFIAREMKKSPKDRREF